MGHLARDGGPTLVRRSFFNGSKRYYCLYVQCIASLNGTIFDVYVSNGSTNDQGLFIGSRTRDLLRQMGMKVIGDRGYPVTDVTVVTDIEVEDQEDENRRQFHYRAVIETVFAIVKDFECTASTFRQAVALHKMAVLVSFQLAAQQLKKSPLRGEDYF